MTQPFKISSIGDFFIKLRSEISKTSLNFSNLPTAAVLIIYTLTHACKIHLNKITPLLNAPDPIGIIDEFVTSPGKKNNARNISIIKCG